MNKVNYNCVWQFVLVMVLAVLDATCVGASPNPVAAEAVPETGYPAFSRDMKKCLAPITKTNPRLGIGNALAKLRRGEKTSVVYFGASQMAMPNGWCARVTQWLRARFPNARIVETISAVGGTGSDLGVFRFRRDVLVHEPDLVFISMANDVNALPYESLRNMEGFLRQLWKARAQADVIFAYAGGNSGNLKKGYFQRGLEPYPASLHDAIAEHFGIPAVSFGMAIASDYAAGRLVMSVGELPFPAPDYRPKQDVELTEKAAAAGKIFYARDGVHPTQRGHEMLFEAVKELFAKMENLPPVDHAAKLEPPLAPDNREQAKMIPITQDMLVGHWKKLPADNAVQQKFAARGGQWWLTETPGDKLVFRFCGRLAKVYDLNAPDGCRVRIRIDGVERPKPVNCFDQYSAWCRLSQLVCLPDSSRDAVHTIEIEVDPVQPDRRPVLKQCPKANVNSPAFNGTKFYVSQLMLVGDLLPMRD